MLKNSARSLCTQNYDISTPQALLKNPSSSLNLTASTLKFKSRSKEYRELFQSVTWY